MRPERLIHIGRLDTAAEAPELIFTPGWDRLVAQQTQTGIIPSPQSGIMMVHRIDPVTNTQLNALVDKVNRILSRKTLIMVLVVAAVAFLIGRHFFGKKADKPKRRKHGK